MTENRAAAVGIFAGANEFITADALTLIDAGIAWILEGAAPTEDFVNTHIGQHTGVLLAEFNAKSTADSVDGVVGLSQVEPDSYGDMGVNRARIVKGGCERQRTPPCHYKYQVRDKFHGFPPE